MQNVEEAGPSEELAPSFEDNVSSLADPEQLSSEPFELGRENSGLMEEPSSNSLQQEGTEQAPAESTEGITSRKGKETRRSQEQLLKNRTAQRRFRERQKSRIIELEEWTSSLTLEIQQLKDDKEGLHVRNAALVRLAEQKTWQLEQAKTCGFVVDDDVPIFTDTLELTIHRGRPLTLQPQQVQALNREDLVRIWKEYTKRLAECLADDQAAESGSLQAEVAQLTSELVVLLLRVSICSPLVFKAFAAHNMETGGTVEDDLESLCRSLAIEMGLSLTQRQEMVQLRQLFLSKQYAIARQRSDTISSLVDLQNAAGSLGPERKSSQAFIQAHEAVVSVRQSLQEEHSLKLDFMSTVFKHLMKPHQLAHCVVQSYPWFPDTLALTSWIAAEAGDSQALAFLGNNELRHMSSASGLSGFALSMGGSGRPEAMRSVSAGGLHSTPHTSAGTGVFPGVAMWGPVMQTLSGQSGMQHGHSPVSSPLLSPQPISPASPHATHRFPSHSPANSPQFPADHMAQGPRSSLAPHNPFADGGQGPPWGL